MLSGTPHSEPSDNLTHFAVGYWWLLQGADQKALVPLQKASEAEDLQDYFDIQFTLARALYLSDQKERATQLLKTLTSRLWNNALGTLSPPLLEPERYAPQGVRDQWDHALNTGNLPELKRLIKSNTDDSVRSLAQQILLHLAEGHLEMEFDDQVIRFFEALRFVENAKDNDNAQLYVLAAYLAFARGEIITGWRYLNETAQRATPFPPAAVKVALFWQKWLQDASVNLAQTDVGLLLVSLLPLLQQSRWRVYCEQEAFDRCWEIFRQSCHSWRLERPLCYALPAPPSNYKELERWVEENHVKHALRYLMEELEREESVL